VLFATSLGGRRIEFEYDYHRLKRWLQKMCSIPRGFIGSVQNLSHIYSGDGFGLHDLRLIERSHVHVALGGPCRAGDVAQQRGRQVEA
jgi:hypothetical protein